MSDGRKRRKKRKSSGRDIMGGPAGKQVGKTMDSFLPKHVSTRYRQLK